jgi:hypothetical protein
MLRQHRLPHNVSQPKTNTQPLARKEALGRDARNLDANSKARTSRANFIRALSWDWPIMPGKIMQGRLEGGGSFGNGLLHCGQAGLPPRRRMDQRPQACPTQIAANTTARQTISQTEGGGSTSHPVPLLKQSSPQPALHLSADSLSDRALPESMLLLLMMMMLHLLLCA